jgi:hypothetical protein
MSGNCKRYHAIGRRGSVKANHFVHSAADVLAPEFFDICLRFRRDVLRVAILIFDISFNKYIGRRLGLRV